MTTDESSRASPHSQGRCRVARIHAGSRWRMSSMSSPFASLARRVPPLLAALVLGLIAFTPRGALATCQPLSNTDLFLDPATIPSGEIGTLFAETDLSSPGSINFPLSPSPVVGIEI